MEQQLVHFKVKASLVILLIDDFMDRVIMNEGVKVRIGNQIPIQKPDGYYVFTNLSTLEVEIEVSSYRFQNERIKLSLDSLSEGLPILKIRLKPDVGYVLPKETTICQGDAKENGTISIVAIDVKKPLKLLYNYQAKSESIQIYNPEKEDLDGRHLSIYDTEKQNFESVMIKETISMEEGIYRLEKPSSKSYKKVSTRILPINEGRLIKDQKYFIPLKEAATEVWVSRTYEDGRVVQGMEQIIIGKVNVLEER